MKKRFWFILLLLNPLLLKAQSAPAGKVGLTLSGGGAKGLSHIGILQAIDSAGLKIDAITGTSMGAVVGSLYAIGYSGKDIEKIARQLDWNDLFMSTPKLKEVAIITKEEYGRYPLQIPLEKGKIKPYTGILEAQGIWKVLAQLYLPVYNIKNFNQFNIPFECVATDLVTGEPVILREGDITTAVRASMAIPSLFTAVDYQGTKLIDGGVVRNFPVENLRQYGIDYFIGVNISQGLGNVERLKTPIDVLLQIAFYKDAANFQQQKELCDLLIEPNLGDFSAASFSAADSLIDIGIATGLAYYPQFKRLADSLRHNETYQVQNRLPALDTFMLDAIEITGLDNVACENFISLLALKTNTQCREAAISSAIDKAYSTLDYRKISYSMIPIQPGHALIRFDVRENPKSFLNLGLHYTPYSGSALIANITSQNELVKNSRTSLKLNISENFRAQVKHQQFLSKARRWGMELSGYGEFFKFPIYLDFQEKYKYENLYGQLDLNAFKILGGSTMMGIGLRREWLGLKPDISDTEYFTAKNRFWNSYFYFKRNTLDEHLYPRRGTQIEWRGGLIFNQRPDAALVALNKETQLGDSLRINSGRYPQLLFKLTQLTPLSPKVSFLFQLSTAINFLPTRSFVNYYSVGGLQNYLRNQITFAGLRENQVNTNSIFSTQVGVQLEPFEKIFLTLRANTALYDFIDLAPRKWSGSNFLSGYSFSAGHKSFLGPIEFSLLYNDQTRTFAGYVIVGYSF